jgi:hypothetical protein
VRTPRRQHRSLAVRYQRCAARGPEPAAAPSQRIQIDIYSTFCSVVLWYSNLLPSNVNVVCRSGEDGLDGPACVGAGRRGGAGRPEAASARHPQRPGAALRTTRLVLHVLVLSTVQHAGRRASGLLIACARVGRARSRTCRRPAPANRPGWCACTRRRSCPRACGRRRWIPGPRLLVRCLGASAHSGVPHEEALTPTEGGRAEGVVAARRCSCPRPGSCRCRRRRRRAPRTADRCRCATRGGAVSTRPPPSCSVEDHDWIKQGWGGGGEPGPCQFFSQLSLKFPLPLVVVAGAVRRCGRRRGAAVVPDRLRGGRAVIAPWCEEGQSFSHAARPCAAPTGKGLHAQEKRTEGADEALHARARPSQA